MKNTLAIVFAVAILGCSQKKVDTKAIGEKVMQLSKDWSQAASTGDVNKTLSYWTDDAFVMPAGQAPLKGKQAIQQMVEESFKMPGFRISWEPQSVEVSESGDMAYLIENTLVAYEDSTGKQVLENAKAVTIWRKQPDGTWKAVVDISSADPSQNK